MCEVRSWIRRGVLHTPENKFIIKNRRGRRPRRLKMYHEHCYKCRGRPCVCPKFTIIFLWFFGGYGAPPLQCLQWITFTIQDSPLLLFNKRGTVPRIVHTNSNLSNYLFLMYSSTSFATSYDVFPTESPAFAS
mgnify:CR=1 FL=1